MLQTEVELKIIYRGTFLLLGPLDNVHQLPERNPQTVILDVFPSIPWNRLKIVENSLTLSMKDGICFLSLNLGGLSDKFDK